MLKLFKNITKKDIVFILCCISLVAFEVWLELKIPDYMSKITVLIETPGSLMKDVLKEGGLMLSCAFGSLIATVIVTYLASILSSDFSYNIREKIFSKVQKFSTAEMKKFQVGSLITRTTNDVTQIEMLIAIGLQAFVKAPIMAVWAITKILNKSIELSKLTGLCVAILLVFVTVVMLIVVPKFSKIQKLTDRINQLVKEHITGVRVIHAFNAEEYEESKFNKVNAELTNTFLFNQRIFSLMNPMMNFVMHFLSLGIYFIGAILIDKANMLDKLTIFSNVVVFTSYGMQVIMSFLMLAMIFMVIPRAQISAKRINEILNEKISIIGGNKTKKDSKSIGTIEFKNVSFKYPDADECILENISFDVKKGETVAFIGSTGSGKSTLINLIPRFYDVTEGSILVDGIDIREYKLEELHNKIGYVSQKAFMFNGSVKSNVAYGDSGFKINEVKIKEALKISQAENFVAQMEGKYDAHIARGGTNISGGQKQRINIARAIAKNPEIYIFDDSFSALDYKTDATLRKELKKYTKDATSLIVAQRIGTILDADKILVLEDGKCVGIGTHKELMNSCKIYKEIALSQLSEEELKNA